MFFEQKPPLNPTNPCYIQEKKIFLVISILRFFVPLFSILMFFFFLVSQLSNSLSFSFSAVGSSIFTTFDCNKIFVSLYSKSHFCSSFNQHTSTYNMFENVHLDHFQLYFPTSMSNFDSNFCFLLYDP